MSYSFSEGDKCIEIWALSAMRDPDARTERLTTDSLVCGYEWAARKRPFFHPVSTPAGHVLTTNAPDDHPWHHGLWFTIKFVNGENFWEEYDSYGVLRHVERPVADQQVSGDAMGELGRRPGVAGAALEAAGSAWHWKGDLVWIRPDRETVIIDEKRQISFVPIDGESYAIDFRTELVPRADVELDRTPFTTWGGYGGLAFRGRGDFHDTRLLLSDGRLEQRVLGERAAWLDLSGAVGGEDGDAPAGICILDSPSNPSHPVPWYASTRAATYGDEGWSNFVNAAFLWEGPVSVGAGDTISFDYRVIVHDGIWDSERAQAGYDRWVDGE